MNGRWKRALAGAALVAGTAGTATVAVPSIADAGDPCAARQTSQAFAPWYDTNEYFVASNGTFESGAGGWTLANGARVVSAQEPWRINGASHAKAMSIPRYASATTPSMCVASNEEWLRFFYRSPGVPGSAIQVKIEVSNSRGTSINTWAVDGNRAGWFVSPQIYLPNLRDANGEQWVTVSFYPINTQADWVIDDVMIDPFVGRK